MEGSENPQQITVDEPKSVTAAFERAFYLAENGVTIICTLAKVGDTGVVDGIEYKKRTNNSITTANASTCCTSNITDMSFLFNKKSDFNGDISHWDVSSVTDMGSMFSRAESFNQDIGNWDVSNVTDMSKMFDNAYSFNQDLSNWCVAKIDTKPDSFARSSPLQDDNKPVWGTCPGN